MKTVKVSNRGREILSNRVERQGTLFGRSGLDPYCVKVLWDSLSLLEHVHESFVEEVDA